MRLLIVSHTSHYQKGDEVVGWSPTIQEIDNLANLFDELVHVAPIHVGDAPTSSCPYTAKNVRLHGVAPSGGAKLKDKLSILTHISEYAYAIRRELKLADVIHVRCPANISLIALLYLILASEPKYRWIKYAGNWQPYHKEALSYKFQRWVLQKNLHRGIVTINGNWKDPHGHIFTFYNPCLTEIELSSAAKAAEEKQVYLPIQLLFVGRIEVAKGVGELLAIAKGLSTQGMPFKLTIVGDGPENEKFRNKSYELGLEDQVHFMGGFPRDQIGEYYKKSHILLLPSISEGWPKVLSEAMAYGVVPVANAVGSIPQVLTEAGSGIAISQNNVEDYITAIQEVISNPETWKAMSKSGVKFAIHFTYSHYLQALRNTFSSAWKITL